MNSRWRIATFMLAFIARMSLALLAAHWMSIGAVWAVGGPLEIASEVSLFLTLVVGIGLVAVVMLSRRIGLVRERARQGPAVLGGHSIPIMVCAAASSTGGMALFGSQPSPAMWAMGLSTIVFMFETAVLVSMLLDPSLRTSGDVDAT